MFAMLAAMKAFHSATQFGVVATPRSVRYQSLSATIGVTSSVIHASHGRGAKRAESMTEPTPPVPKA